LPYNAGKGEARAAALCGFYIEICYYIWDNAVALSTGLALRYFTLYTDVSGGYL